MSQNDFVIANQTAPNFRSDLNNALQALASLSSGSSAPSTTYANMLWYDTGTNTLKMRSEADDAWISIGYLDQTSNAFRIFDDTQVVNSSGTQTGLIGDQATATWEAGVGTTESLVSPAKVKAAVEALTPEVDTGISALPNPFILSESVGSSTFSGPDTTDYADTALVGSYRVVVAVEGAGTGLENIELRLSDNNGSTWATTFTFSGVIGNDAALSAEIFINTVSGECALVGTTSLGQIKRVAGTATLPTGATNALQIRTINRSMEVMWYALGGRG